MSESNQPCSPPLDVEEAMDLILACASHTSREEGQRRMGQMLLEEYFVKLREGTADPTAKSYLDHLVPIIASAVRAFAVERQAFAARWKAMEHAHEERAKYIDGWTGYSPLNKAGVLYRVAGPAFLGSLFTFLLAEWGRHTYLAVCGTVGGVALGYLVIDWALKWYRTNALAKLRQELPVDIDSKWAESLDRYRKILRNFLLLSLKVRERFYPDLPPALPRLEHRVYEKYDIPHVRFQSGGPSEKLSLNELNDFLAAIVERHFSFGT